MSGAWNNSAVAVLGWTLFHSLWEVAVVYALFRAVLLLVRREHADVRYRFSVAALVLCVLVVAATGAYIVTGTSASTPDVLPTPVDSAEPQQSTASVGDGLIVDLAGRVRFPKLARFSWPDRIVAAVGPHIPVGVVLWIVGTAVMAVWQAGGLTVAVYLFNAGIPVDERMLARFRQLERRVGTSRPARYLITPKLLAPACIGWLKPVVLLPISLTTNFSPAQVEFLVAHELAHLKRWDHAITLLQSVVETALFYHPCVWLLSLHIRNEREACCDRIVSQATGDANGYGETLYALSDLQDRLPRFVLGAASGSLLDRVTRLVDGRQKRRLNVPAVAAALTLCVLCGSGLAFAVTSRYASIREQDAAEATHEADFVFDLFHARAVNPQLEPALVQALAAVRDGARSTDGRFDALVSALDRGGDPNLIWDRYCSTVDLARYPTSEAALPTSWSFKTADDQGRLAKVLWKRARVSPTSSESRRFCRAAVLVAAMRRERSGIGYLSKIVLDRGFLESSGLPRETAVGLVRYVSLANDSFVAAARSCAVWSGHPVRPLAGQPLGRFPEVDHQLAIEVARHGSPELEKWLRMTSAGLSKAADRRVLLAPLSLPPADANRQPNMDFMTAYSSSSSYTASTGSQGAL